MVNRKKRKRTKGLQSLCQPTDYLARRQPRDNSIDKNTSGPLDEGA